MTENCVGSMEAYLDISGCLESLSNFRGFSWLLQCCCWFQLLDSAQLPWKSLPIAYTWRALQPGLLTVDNTEFS